MATRSYSPKTIKILFGSSGNQCAHPECTLSVIIPGTEESDDAVMAQICHIYAASDDGPRGAPNLTNNERNSPDNLILLCGFHHSMVDTQYQNFPAELLKNWKRNHEAKYQQETEEAIRRQEQIQQYSYLASLTNQQIEEYVRCLRQARNLVGYPYIDNARVMAARIEKNELAGGSSTVKAQALAWSARILSPVDIGRAKELLEKSRDFGGGAETEIANAFIVASETGETDALALLAPIKTLDSRSAMLRIVSNNRGPEKALDWAQSAGLELSSFDSDGKLNLILNEMSSERWNDAYEHVQLLTSADFLESPVLNYAAAQVYFAQIVPIELQKMEVLCQLPFNAANFRISDDQQALYDRRCAIEHYKKLESIAKQFGVNEALQFSAEMALWLRLRTPELYEVALEDLREDMRDDELMLKRFPLAEQFGIKIDLSAVELRVNKQVALTGKGTIDEALARLALLMKKEPPAALEYFNKHRDQLNGFIKNSFLLGLEIELLCKTGQIATAKTVLATSTLEEPNKLGPEHFERMIAEAEGADPTAARRKLYEKTGDILDLLNLVNILEQERAWQDLCPLTEVLFNKTHSVEDACRVIRVLGFAREHERSLQFLQRIPEIVEREIELRSRLAWTLYNDGQFNRAYELLISLRAERDNKDERTLFVNLAIATGQWDRLVGYTSHEWEHRDHRTAEELIRTGQLAFAVKAPHAKDLIIAATEADGDNPHILTLAYFHATSAGWESDPIASGWLISAAAKSGEDGPLKSVSMADFVNEYKPDWDRRQDQTYKALNAGQITISGAAYVLNQSMIQNCLLRPAANRHEPDARRRSLVYAFSGGRPSTVQPNLKRIALDLTATFTFAQLGLLPKLIDHFKCVLIPDQLLVWLFQERQRVVFHQPSRVKDAQFLKRLIADKTLSIFTLQKQANPRLAREVGFDLAAMLIAANESSADSYVIHPSPVHRLGSIMEEEVDLTAFDAHLCSCQAVVEALHLKGWMTYSEVQHSFSFLKLNEKRWPNEPRIRDGAILYLDDISTTYLRAAGVLGKLKGAGFTVYVTKSLDDEYNQLLAYEDFAEECLSTIENIRAAIAPAISDGRVEIIATQDRDSEDKQGYAQLNFMNTNKAVDAFVIDDRFVNRYLNFTNGEQQIPILTSLDIVMYLVESGGLTIDEGREYRTTLRKSGYTFVPVLEDELIHHLLQAPLDNGSLLETAELRAIREAAQRLRMSKILHLPNEHEWLKQYTLALTHAIRAVWEVESDQKVAEARSEWLLAQLDIRGWASIAEREAARHFSVRSYAGILLSLSYAPKCILKKNNEIYLRWVDERILSVIKTTEPEIFDQVVAMAAEVLCDALNTEWKDDE